MSDETLSPKQMDEAIERAEADTQAALAHRARCNEQYAASVERVCAITNQDVIAAFNSLGGVANQVQALRGELEKRMASDAAVIAINNALADGVLAMDALGSVRKP